jgi:hypothetical protein
MDSEPTPCSWARSLEYAGSVMKNKKIARVDDAPFKYLKQQFIIQTFLMIQKNFM